MDQLRQGPDLFLHVFYMLGFCKEVRDIESIANVEL
jgi:hypothetical protein